MEGPKVPKTTTEFRRRTSASRAAGQRYLLPGYPAARTVSLCESCSQAPAAVLIQGFAVCSHCAITKGPVL